MPTRHTPQGDWLTIPELAEELKVSTATIYAWRYQGEGPRGARFGKHVRFARSDVDAWIRTHMDPQQPDTQRTA